MYYSEIGASYAKLLDDYSVKLRSLYEQWDKIYGRRFLMFYSVVSSLTLVVSTFFIFLSLPDELLSDGFIKTASLVIFFVLVYGVILVTVYVYKQQIRKRRSVEEDIRITFVQLENLVHRASQFLEHGSRSELVELEFRLADAESALRRVEEFVKIDKFRSGLRPFYKNMNQEKQNDESVK